jgi:hypothetical protein
MTRPKQHWSAERRAAHGARVRAAHAAGRYTGAGEAIRVAHKAGRYAAAPAKIGVATRGRKWTDAQRKAFSESLRANRPVRPAPLTPKKRALATDAFNVRARAVMQRLRARRRLIAEGLPIPEHLQSQRERRITARAFWPTVAAALSRIARAVDASVSRLVVKPIHPLECLWRDHTAIEYVPVLKDPRFVRDMRADPPRNEGIADWTAVHRQRELASLVAAQQADAQGATA